MEAGVPLEFGLQRPVDSLVDWRPSRSKPSVLQPLVAELPSRSVSPTNSSLTANTTVSPVQAFSGPAAGGRMPGTSGGGLGGSVVPPPQPTTQRLASAVAESPAIR